MRAQRTDTTQRIIVEALRKVGCLVWITSGAIDLVVWTPRLETHARVFVGYTIPWQTGAIVLIDCKTKRGRAFRKTKRQGFMEAAGWPVTYATTPEEALLACGFSVTP